MTDFFFHYLAVSIDTPHIGGVHIKVLVGEGPVTC